MPHRPVLIPVAQPVQFQRVQIIAVLLQELVDQELMFFLANQVEVPQRVVEDHQHIGILMQRAQNLGKSLVAGMGRIVGQRFHPLRGPGAGQVVHAEVKRLLAIGSAPLHRNRNPPRARDRAQQHRRSDVVVVGNGDHRLQIQLLDLAAFQVKGQPGRHRRRPVAGRVVDAQPVHPLRTPLQPRQQRAHHRVLVAEVGQKIQRFVGLVGVAVQRYS